MRRLTLSISAFVLAGCSITPLGYLSEEANLKRSYSPELSYHYRYYPNRPHGMERNLLPTPRTVGQMATLSPFGPPEGLTIMDGVSSYPDPFAPTPQELESTLNQQLLDLRADIKALQHRMETMEPLNW